MNLPSTETESDTENEPKAQEPREAEGRDLRRRRKRDYNQNPKTTNNIPIRQKPSPKNPKPEANKKNSEVLDTVTLLEQENKEGMLTNRALKNNIDIKDNVIKDMEKAIIDKSNKLKEIENTLKEQTETLQTLTKEKDQQILILADSNREPIITEMKKMRPQWKIKAPNTIFTTDHLVQHHEEHPLPNNTTNIIMMGTNDIRKNRGTDAINNIPKIKNHTNNHTIISNIPPTNIDVGNEETNDEIIQDRINYNKKINNTFTRTAKTTELNKGMRTHPTSILKRDGIHLTDNGARLIATTWIRTIEEPTTEDIPLEQDSITIEKNKPDT